MGKLFAIFLLSFSWFIFIGCTASKKMVTDKQTLKFTIVLGSGGGFTGSYQGKMIDTTGVVYYWEGRTYYNSNKKIVDSLSQNQIAKLNTYFSTNNFADYSFREVGNINNFLTLSTPDIKISFSWKESSIPDHVPDKIKELYYLIINTLDNANKKEQR